MLDDLHRADVPSLRLLEFVIESVWTMPVLLLGTYRDTETGRAPEFRRVLGGVASRAGIQVFTVQGLTREEAAAFVHAALPESLSASTTSDIVERSGGNPFFLGEMTRLIAAHAVTLKDPDTGRALHVPDTVRETIRRRRELLPPATRQVLPVVAVLGQEFGAAALVEFVDGGWDEAADALAPAVSSGLVDEVAGHLGRYRFRHALIREAVYEELSAAERAQLHYRVAEVLEALYRADPEPHLEELAYQFFMSAPTGDLAAAIDYCRRAGAKAMRGLAYEEAARYHERTLELLQLLPGRAPEQECSCLLALGEAWARAGDRDQARGWYTQAFESADRRRDAGQSARAALGYGGLVVAVGVSDRRLIGFLERASESFDAADAAMHARLLARQAMELYWSPERVRGLELATRAVDQARSSGDPLALGFALNARRFVRWGPDHRPENLSDSLELLRLASAARDIELTFQAHRWLFLDHLQSGDLVEATRQVDACARLAEDTRQPQHHWYVAVYRANVALLEGRFVDAKAHAELGRVLGHRAQSEAAELFYLTQALLLSRTCGGLEALEKPMLDTAQRMPALPVARCMVGVIRAEIGNLDGARAILHGFARSDFQDIPRDLLWQAGLCLLADVCADVGDQPVAGRLYTMLLPYAEENALLGSPAALGSSTATSPDWRPCAPTGQPLRPTSR